MTKETSILPLPIFHPLIILHVHSRSRVWSFYLTERAMQLPKSKGTKRQTMVNKIQHRKLMIEQHERQNGR
jgi:hypothetical protein